MDIALALDTAIKEVCPIDGVSIGSLTDRSLWRVDFKNEATQEQRQAAIAVLEAFEL